MTDLVSAVTAYLAARTDADSAPPWARIMREDVAAARMRELLAACFAADVSLDGALVLHAPDYVRGEAERWGAMVARIAPPAPVVLGARRPRKWGETYGPWVRLNLATGAEGACAEDNGDGEPVWCLIGDVARIEVGDGDMDDADDEARERGWVLLDAEPLPEPVALGAWYEMGGTRYRDAGDPRHPYATIEVDSLGWSVKRRAGHGGYLHIAYGPQTGAEGERLAMVAALALGFVEGT